MVDDYCNITIRVSIYYSYIRNNDGSGDVFVDNFIVFSDIFFLNFGFVTEDYYCNGFGVDHDEVIITVFVVQVGFLMIYSKHSN